jgi:hypothetical protein
MLHRAKLEAVNATFIFNSAAEEEKQEEVTNCYEPDTGFQVPVIIYSAILIPASCNIRPYVRTRQRRMRKQVRILQNIRI